MKKILLAIDGKNLDMPTLDFACYLGRLTRSGITGVFLENLVENEKPVLKRVHGMDSIDWEVEKTSEEYIEKNELIEKNIATFKEACEKRSANARVHRARGVPADELIRESRFADLLVINPSTSFNKTYEGAPTEFVKDVLDKAECPVIIAPESFEGVDEIIFTYDGSNSAAFAIKQFTYLLPALHEKKAVILRVNDEGVWLDQDKYNFKEWLQNHYSKLEFDAMKGNVEDRLFDYLYKRKNVFIVMGAYGRSSLSRFFKHSRADLLIKTLTQPIFISHY